MKRKTLFNLLAALSLVLAAAISLVSPPIAQAAGIIVPDDYPTIQQAVDAASPGDTVHVRAGTYYEHVSINKALVLQGEDRQTTIIDGSSGGTVLYTSADGVSISGFTVRNGSPDGIHLYRADNCLVDDVSILSSSVTGLHLQISTYNAVTNVTVSDNVNGINTGDQGSHHNTFQNITVHSNAAYGFVGYAGSHYTQILDSTICGNPRGVAIGWSRNWRIENTEICSSSNVGVYIDTGDYATVENCEIHSNTQGVRFTGYHANHHTFVRNRIHSNTEAGFMFNNDARYNLIEENEIYDNNVGVYMNESPARPSYGNTLCQNSFVNNTTHALVENSSQPNAWDCGYPSGGNYWDDYGGIDVYSGPAQDQPGSDGIGDTPYEINARNRDNYPLMGLWNTVQATVDIDPDTLNLKSQGKWVTAHVELPEGYDVSTSDASTVTLAGTISAEDCPAGIGDDDDDGIPDLMVKFNRRALIEYLDGTTGEVALTVSGELSDGTFFEGSDTVTVIDPGEK